MTNKAVWNKEKGLCFRHYVQSFHPDEKITPDQANEIGLEFAKRAWPGYGVRWERGRKNITYTCFKEPKYKNGAYRKCNDDTATLTTRASWKARK